MNWPESLIVELAARRCVVFMGAGASAGCVSALNAGHHPPRWGEFLDGLKALVTAGADIPVIDDLVGKERFLDAAEVMLSSIPPADFTKFIRDTFQAPNYQASEIHKAVLQIDPKLLVTTNYDEIYDHYCRSGGAEDGYNICRYYQPHLVQDLRSPVRLVIKAHGCVSDSSGIILSRSQYFGQRQRFGGFFRVLDALFLTNTLLFVGYSLSDPDIQLVLENATIAAPSAHPHYAVIPSGMVESLKHAAQKAYNIQFIEFPAGQYDILDQGMQDLAADVTQYRIDHPA